MKLKEDPIGLKRPWITIIITVLLVSVILVVGNQTYKATEAAAFDEFNQKQLVLAKGTTTGIELYFETLAEDLKAIGRMPEIIHLEEAHTRQELQRRLHELEPLGINDIGVLDADGILRYSANAPQIEGIDFSWREYFQEAKKMTPNDNTYIIEFVEFKGVEAGQKGVLVAVPMFETATGKFAGVVLCTLKLDTITQKFVAHVRSSERGHAFLIDDEYNVLWAPDVSFFGKNLLEESEGFPEFQQVVKHLVDAVSGKAEYSYYKFDESKGRYTEETEEKLLAHEHIRLGKEIWSLGVWAPKEEARKLIRAAYLRLVLLVGLAILIILIGSFYALTVSSRISRILEREVETKTGALKESEEKYRTLIESSSDCICHIDLDGKFVYMNPGGVRLNELDSQDEVIGLDCTRGIKDAYKDLMKEAMERARNGMTTGLEYESTNAKGKELWWESVVGPIKDEKGKVMSIVRISRNVTDRKLAEEQIKASLKEKEALLQEVHHRVKNNMQVISSLLKLQSRQIRDKKDLELFKESQNRIKSMAFVHEKLYQSKDLANIELGSYIRNLANGLFRAYGVDSDKIALKMDVEGVPLGVDVAIPSGLIINELISNSLKHAFPDGRKGEIEITLRKIGEDEIELVVSDDGVGITEEVDFKNTESLGMHIVRTLVKQLNGEIKLERGEGTKFQIKFRGTR